MSVRHALVLIGVAALATAPFALPADRAPAAQADIDARGTDTARVRALLAGIRGTPPVACELALMPVGNGWWSGTRTPDAPEDVAALARSTGERVDDPLAVPVLAAALDDADACVRRVAVRVLGRSRLPEARQVFTTALRATDPTDRVQGAIGLGLVDHPADMPLLIAALSDTDARVREAAAWAIGAMH